MLCADVSRTSFQAGDGAGNRDRTITSEARSRSNLGGWDLVALIGMPYAPSEYLTITLLGSISPILSDAES
jgi:hypothetical protein